MNDMELRSRMTAYVSDQTYAESKQPVFVHDREPFDFPLKKKLEQLFQTRFGAVETRADVGDDFIASLLGEPSGLTNKVLLLIMR